MTEKTLTTENIKPALDALRGELAPWPVVAKKQDRLNTAQLNAANSGITSSLVAQIIANTAAIRALESAITGTGLRALVVASLPAVGTTGILYIVPVTTYDPDTDADVVNYSNEYIWIPVEGGTASEGHYEQVGQTGIVINNGQLNITVNGTSVGTFTANQSGDTTAAITVPTNADYVDRTTNQTIAGTKTFSSTIEGTAAKAVADEDGTSIKTGYVNVAGNQTVTGDKSFTGSNTFNNILPNATNTYSLGSSSYRWSSVYAKSYYGYTMYFDSTSERVIRFQTNGSNNYKNFDTYIGTAYTQYDNTVAMHRSVGRRGDTTTGATISDVDTSFSFFKAHINYKSFDIVDAVKATNDNTENSLKPITTNVTDLGTSTNQWKSVYAQSYYYNGTAWGLDKANVWSKEQTILQSTTAQFKLKNSNIAIGDEVPSSQKTLGSLTFTDSNGVNMGFMDFRDSNLGNTFVRILVRQRYDANGNRSASGTTYDSGIDIGVLNDKTPYVSPTSNATAQLGTSTNKWKTLNGVNPGALSLPDVSVSVAVDTTDWIYDGLTSNLIKFNNAVQTFSGWLYITAQNTSASDRIVVRYIGSDASNLTFISGKFDGASSIFVACPIVAGVSTYVWSTKALNTIKIYKAQGNV